MEKLILVRHGEESGDHLTEVGRRTIVRLSGHLLSIAHGRATVMFTSPSPRARETAAIIAERLDVQVEEHPVLRADDKVLSDLEAATKLVLLRMDEMEVLILVTHLPYVERLPAFLGLSMQMQFAQRHVPKGCARVIDFKAKTDVDIDV